MGKSIEFSKSWTWSAGSHPGQRGYGRLHQRLGINRDIVILNLIGSVDMMCVRGPDAGRMWRCGTCENRFPAPCEGTSVANSNSFALNCSWESAMQFGRSGVGLELPPLRSGSQNGFNSFMTLHASRANLIQNLSAGRQPFTWATMLFSECQHLSHLAIRVENIRRGPGVTGVGRR